MWIARNKDGDLRLFEFPPKRYHEGPMLSSKLTGFNDAVTLGHDEYSFWAVPEYCNSNVIKSYGLKFYTGPSESMWVPYIPEVFKNMKWEDEPIEVELIIKRNNHGNN